MSPRKRRRPLKEKWADKTIGMDNKVFSIFVLVLCLGFIVYYARELNKLAEDKTFKNEYDKQLYERGLWIRLAGTAIFAILAFVFLIKEMFSKN